MLKLFFAIIKNIIILKVITLIVPGISAHGFPVFLAAAVLLWLLNTLLKPVLLVVTLPLTIVSLGLFAFVINGFLFYLIGRFVQGFYVQGFFTAVLGSFVFSVIDMLIGFFFKNSGFNIFIHKNARTPLNPTAYDNVIDVEVVRQREDSKRLSDTSPKE